MASGTIYDRAVGYVFTVVDDDRPDVDEDEKADVEEFLEREDEGEDVVGH